MRALAYNSQMLHAFDSPVLGFATTTVGPAMAERLTLWLNHLLASEPAAAEHLVRHAGRCVALRADALPSWLPRPPVLRFRVTPAGLLEWAPKEGVPEAIDDLQMSFEAQNPARAALDWLNGRRPSVAIQGDAAFAADLHWVVENLQWDVQADLSRLFGPVAAEGLARAGQGIAAALRAAAQAAATLAAGANGSPSR
jgi:ubiquinone biosynthesis protein UbiJ